MKEVDDLQEILKTLPKYTLTNEQKNNIMLTLKRNEKSRKRVQLFIPLMSLTAIFLTAYFLFFTNSNESTSWMNGWEKMFQPQVKLTAQQADIFHLSPYKQELTGIEGKIGMLFNTQFVAGDIRRGSKMMLYFWGDIPEFENKNYRVEAWNTYNEKIILSEGNFNSFLIGEDAQQILTSFTPFPTEGEWQLSFYVDDRLFEEFRIEVLPPFPKTEQYILINHPKELKVGEETEFTIESSVESGTEIEVKLINKKGSIVSEHVFIQNGSFMSAGEYIYHYHGHIEFPNHGTWRLMIDGEKTKSFKN